MQIKLTNILKELQINNPNPDEIMQEINMFFNEYFIKWLETHVTNIDEDVWMYLPDYLDEIKNIMHTDDQFDHDQFDDDMAEEYFNLNMLSDVKKKLWKKYFENVNTTKIKKYIHQHINKHDYVDKEIDWFFRYGYEDIFDDIYAPIIIEPFIKEILDEVILNYEHGEDLNELQINNPNVMRPFKNNKWERGNNVKETIINFIRANQYQPENIIVDNVSVQSHYNSLVVARALRSVLIMGVMRRKATNPSTGRKIFVYYVPQGSLFELQINKPNPTAEEVYNYFENKVRNTNLIHNNSFMPIYMDMCEPYNRKYKIMGCIMYQHEFELLSQPDLNKLYREMKQIVQKYA